MVGGAYELTQWLLRSSDNIEIKVRGFDGLRTERIFVRKDLKSATIAAFAAATFLLLASTCAGIVLAIVDWALHAFMTAVYQLTWQMVATIAVVTFLCAIAAVIRYFAAYR